MSKEYCEYLSNLATTCADTNKTMASAGFKCNQIYQSTLEHLSKELGIQYLRQLEIEYPEISYDLIKAFVNINDKYGSPIKAIFTMNTENTQKLLYCSPTSLRYTYHALKILHYFKETGQTEIIELGVGYGGLFLAINFFSNILNVSIEKYIMIDLPEVEALVQSYLEANSEHIQIPWVTATKDDYLEKLSDKTDYFFISNYCLSFVSKDIRNNYVNDLLSKCEHGFITWQTSFGVQEVEIEHTIQKAVLNTIEETPQTGPTHAKNLYVIF